MGRIKEVLAELDNGCEVVITEWGMSLAFDVTVADRYNYHLTTNDIEQTMRVIQYLRETKPFQTLAEITKGITDSHPLIDWEGPKTVPDVAVAPGVKKK